MPETAYRCEEVGIVGGHGKRAEAAHGEARAVTSGEVDLRVCAAMSSRS